VGEVPRTKWDFISNNTIGPYEVTIKENGCIIFVSAINGEIITASKHSVGRSEEKVTHAHKGEEWLDIHLSRTGRTRVELAHELSSKNLTAVFELADDEFEEHILSYPKERSGLYLHGLNHNAINFESLPMEEVEDFAREFGFYCVEYFKLKTVNG
jgi:tRNA ligase